MIIHHPKVIISPQKCPFFPQKPHLFNIFSLKNDLRTFVENCCEWHLRDIMGQIAQDAWIWGWGVNLIKAMPGFGEFLFRHPIPYEKVKASNQRLQYIFFSGNNRHPSPPINWFNIATFLSALFKTAQIIQRFSFTLY